MGMCSEIFQSTIGENDGVLDGLADQAREQRLTNNNVYRKRSMIIFVGRKVSTFYVSQKYFLEQSSEENDQLEKSHAEHCADSA